MLLLKWQKRKDSWTLLESTLRDQLVPLLHLYIDLSFSYLYIYNFNNLNIDLYKHVDIPVEKGQKTLAIAVSSDTGLCGGIHSSISKNVKKFVRLNPETAVVIIGMKAKAQIAREAKQNIQMTFDQVAKQQPSWDECALIAQAVIDAKIEHDTVSIFYNAFRSVVAYECVQIPAYNLAAIKKGKNLTAYEVEDDALENFTKFAFANSLYLGVTEGKASEMSSKRTAMENATKNAGEMITKMTLTYNRTRQAVITNELCDIITGASAL